MSDIAKKRAYVYDMYNGRGWHKKVEKMSDAQIVAIYLREQAKADKAKAAAQQEAANNDGSDNIPF